MRVDIKNKILKNKTHAKACLETLSSTPNIRKNEFGKIFTEYLCFKFLLVPAEINTDDFYEICQLSVEKASSLPPGLIDSSEFASKCGGATSAMNKKILFILTLKKEFSIEISPQESVNITTLSQLIECVYSKKAGHHEPS